MANEKNLIPFAQRSESEARESRGFLYTITRAESRGFSQNLQHKKELPIVGSPLRGLQIYFITEGTEMQTVILVFTDRHTEEHTPGGAARLCSNPEVAGKIIDALTDNKPLQARLRRLIDSDDNSQG